MKKKIFVVLLFITKSRNYRAVKYGTHFCDSQMRKGILFDFGVMLHVFVITILKEVHV